MHSNFIKIIYLTGKFGIIIREHVEQFIYTGEYGRISSNNTLAKLEREYGFLKRIDRGKRKSDGYKLTPLGIKEYRRLFGIEPKAFSSLDKLSHSVQIFNFYGNLYKDALNRKILNDKYNIIEEKKIIDFSIHQEYTYQYKNKNKRIISDGFCIYKYGQNKGIVFNLEIENSDRTSSHVAQKTIENYEGYFKSDKWRHESWQNSSRHIFPPVLIVTFSDFKCKELIRNFKKKISIGIYYFFTSYDKLEEHGFSAPIWYNIDGNNMKII